MTSYQRCVMACNRVGREGGRRAWVERVGREDEWVERVLMVKLRAWVNMVLMGGQRGCVEKVY